MTWEFAPQSRQNRQPFAPVALRIVRPCQTSLSSFSICSLKKNLFQNAYLVVDLYVEKLSPRGFHRLN